LDNIPFGEPAAERDIFAKEFLERNGLQKFKSIDSMSYEFSERHLEDTEFNLFVNGKKIGTMTQHVFNVVKLSYTLYFKAIK
jgi:hypothetical protein